MADLIDRTLVNVSSIFGMCDRRLTVSTYPVLRIALFFMRLKSIITWDSCYVTLRRTFREGTILVGGVLTGGRIIFPFVASVLYRKTLS